MDKLEIEGLEALEKQVFDELEKLEYDVDSRSVAELMALALSLPEVPEPPLKPNQTSGSEKVSIRIPRCTLAWYRDTAKQLGMGYQTLISVTLGNSVKGGTT